MSQLTPSALCLHLLCLSALICLSSGKTVTGEIHLSSEVTDVFVAKFAFRGGVPTALIQGTLQVKDDPSASYMDGHSHSLSLVKDTSMRACCQ